MRFLPPSIRRLGLKNYLDTTVDNHNGFDYQDFVTMYDSRVNSANIARAFNIKTRKTILHWIEIHREETTKISKGDTL